MHSSSIILVLAISTLATSCQDEFTCRQDIKFMEARNSNHAYNCGVEYLTFDNKMDLEFICNEFSKMERIFPVTTNYNSGYISISLHPSNNLFFEEVVTLIFTMEKGFVFKMQNRLNYQNDALADFLIQKMGIKNIYSVELCK